MWINGVWHLSDTWDQAKDAVLIESSQPVARRVSLGVRLGVRQTQGSGCGQGQAGFTRRQKRPVLCPSHTEQAEPGGPVPQKLPLPPWRCCSPAFC